MKKLSPIFLLLPLFATGCVFPMGMEGIAKSKAVGGMPPTIAPVEIKEKSKADVEQANNSNGNPRTVVTQPQSPVTPTSEQITSYRPPTSAMLTAADVTEENYIECVQRMGIELDEVEARLR